MNRMKHFLLTIFLFSFIFSDAIEVSPTSLNFGDVLMGNSPTMSFTVTADLDQLVTITPPSFYEIDITELEMVVGQSQEINVTFTPPSTGNWDAQVVLSGSIFGDATVDVYATAVNDISGSLNGTITADYSPYEISNDIFIEEGNSLTIESGVVFEFSDYYSFNIYGDLIIEGNPDDLVTFKSHSTNENGWKGLYFENSNNSNLQYLLIEDVGQYFYEDMESGFIEDDWTQGSGHTSEGHFEYVSSGYEGDCLHLTFDQNAENSNDYKQSVVRHVQDIPITPTMTVKFRYKLSGHGNGQFYVRFNGQEIFQDCNGCGVSSNWKCTGEEWCFEEIDVDDHSNFNYLYGDGENEYEIEFYFNQQNYGSWRHLYVDNVEVTSSIDAAIYADNSNVNILNSAITNNNSNGIIAKQSDIILDHSIIYQNNSNGFISMQSFPLITNSIIFQNTGESIINSLGSTSVMFSSIQDYNLDNNYCGYCTGDTYYTYEDCQSVLEGGYNWVYDSCNISEYGVVNFTPLLNNDLTLSEYSPCIDAANPQEDDACLPPGLGGITADIGMFGGENNCGAAGSNMPAGLPSIDSVVDIPQDQGGYVGIQFQGSVYDGQHSGYDITQYSFWRELDVDPEEGSTIPNGEYYITNRDEYWEWIGEIPAQQFEAYGYTAPTLADSNDETGAFISTFLVVAHTDDDAVFFASDPASGSSIDNLAPTTPDGLFGQYQDMAVNLAWNETEDPDVLYYEVFKDNELIGVSENNTFSDDNVLVAPIYYYLLAYDENYNISESSDVLMYTSDVSGDITQNFQVNVLDIIVLVDIILGNYNGNTEVPEYVLTSSDLNEDNEVNILDIVILANSILDIPLN